MILYDDQMSNNYESRGDDRGMTDLSEKVEVDQTQVWTRVRDYMALL